MELRDYLRIARARWLTLLTFFLLGTLAAGAVATVTPREYTAVAEVIVNTNAGQSAAELVQSADYSQQQVRSYSAVAVRPVVLDPVIAQLGLDETANELAERVRVSSPLNTQLMSIAVTDEAPQQAADIANAVSAQLARVVGDFVPQTDTGARTVSLDSIRSAVPPEQPSAPNLKTLLALGMLAGAVAGVAFVALRESLDTKVRSSADVTAVLTAAQLGTVSHDPRAASHPLVTGASAQSPRAEAYRQIRTNIRFIGAVEPHRLLPITSSVPGEGKTTTAINLALTQVAAGDRVCLVEADLRRPRLAHYLGMEGAVGLTTVLVGDADVADVVQPWGGQGLEVLLSGRLPPNPSELLGSPRMAALLEELAQLYDVVVIDCPPLVPVTDGALVAKACGGAVLVIGSGKVDRAELEFAVDALLTVQAPILGTVLNLVPMGQALHHGYGYGAAADESSPVLSYAEDEVPDEPDPPAEVPDGPEPPAEAATPAAPTAPATATRRHSRSGMASRPGSPLP